MRNFILVLVLLISTTSLYAGDTARVFFVGNSYTGVNNLPQLLATVAASAGDVVITDANTPGGATLQMHSTNATTLSKIALGTWDYVVLQEQSQIPSFPDAQIATSMYPYARLLDSLISSANVCTETVFYMTWGRKNGDASNCQFFPPMCTYSGMDSLLRLRYEILADTNQGIVSPVGALWRMLRHTQPGINLYDADESHPSLAGSYAAACAFYATLFAKDPTAITANAGLPAADAAAIRAAAKTVVFDSLKHWKVGTYTFPVWCRGLTGITDESSPENKLNVFVRGNTLQLTASNSFAIGTRVVFTNAEGKTIFAQHTTSQTNNLSMPLPNLPAGIYFVTITNPDGKKDTRKIFLQ